MLGIVVGGIGASLDVVIVAIVEGVIIGRGSGVEVVEWSRKWGSGGNSAGGKNGQGATVIPVNMKMSCLLVEDT
nr:hypothetical protein [Tanacetum cinerariifolium]